MDPIPLPEHPRPDFERRPWVNLNGAWRFAFDAEDVGEQQQWFEPGKHTFDREIIVPFPWESRLSGIADTEYRGVAWYAREIEIPTGDGWQARHPWLVIGACDWEAKVWVNGQLVGEHVGGYAPFAVNLAPHAQPGGKAFVVIRAKDITDPQQPVGKQVNWYTRTSGLWQTVYLEPRSAVHIQNLRFTCVPNLAEPEADCPIQYDVTFNEAAADASVELFVNNQSVGHGGAKVAGVIAKPRLWHPDAPHLYDARLVVKVGDTVVDEVQSYFGIRTVGTMTAPGRDYKYITLNGKPIYLRGALHQSFHPEGIYQYPDDASVRGDYEYCKKIGLNFLRIHIKTPIPRELYWADKLGVLIMSDIPNYWRHTPQAQAWWEQTLRGAVARDFNHPAIFAWCDFNETWGIGDGQYGPDRHAWVADMYHLTKQLDPTRLCEDNSPCRYDHVITDINSWHFYINEYSAARDHIREVVEKTFPGSTFNYAKGFSQADAPLINSEYGGIGAGQGDQDISWCFKYLTNELRKHDKIGGYVYTELSDIEWEHNGYMNYDRSDKEFGYDFWHPGFSLKDINGPDFVVLDAAPMLELEAGATQTIPVAISHWSDQTAEALTLRWRVDWIDGRGQPLEGTWQTRPAKWAPFAVTPQDAITCTAPGQPGVGALLVEIVDGDAVLARNYLNLTVQAPLPRREVIDDKRIALRFEPADVAAWQWKASPTPLTTASKVAAHGSGFAEYRLALPEGIAADALQSIEVIAELSAKAKDEKLDWPARRTPFDYPQTDSKKFPTDVRLSLNGVEAWRQTLADDPADARGALSHARQQDPGSYGWLVRATVAGTVLQQALAAGKDGRLVIRFEVPDNAEHRGGLAIFGRGLGRYAVDPTCVLLFRQPHGLGADVTSQEPVAVDRLTDRIRAAVPTAEQGPHKWHYTTDKPADHWAQPAFDDGGWKSGSGSFGTRETPNAIVGTRWRTRDIWLRTTFDLTDAKAVVAATLRVHHDEDAEIYLNGEPIAKRPGFVDHYVDVALDATALAALQNGTNVLAVHCHQTDGGQNIDVGLSLTLSPPK